MPPRSIYNARYKVQVAAPRASLRASFGARSRVFLLRSDARRLAGRGHRSGRVVARISAGRRRDTSGAGDRLLAASSEASIKLHRWPTDCGDEPPQSVVEFELSGSLPLTNDGATELLAALLLEFRKPCQPRREGGAA